MRKRYKVVLNVEVDDPDAPYPAGGSYTHLNRIHGIVLQITSNYWKADMATVTLDKIIDKGEIESHETPG